MRHQAHIVTRIGSRYRSIAVTYQSFLDAIYVPGAARRFVKQLQQTTNKRVVQEELRRLEEDEARLDRPLPSKYLSSTLASAYLVAIRETESWASGKGLEWAFHERGKLYQFDADAGFTVFDITNVNAPKYCFLSGNCPNPSSIALDALDYVNSWKEIRHPLPETYRQSGFGIPNSAPYWHHDVKFMLSYSLVSRDALREVWPENFGELDHTDVSQLSLSTLSLGGETVPSLSQLLLLPALRLAIQTNDFGGLNDLLLLPGKLDAILGIFRTSHFFHPFPDEAIDFLVQLIADTQLSDTFDLSHYHLSSSQILSILDRSNPRVSLDLSHNPHVDHFTVQAVLQAHPELKHLILFGTTITPTEWSELLDSTPKIFYHVESILHPCFIDSFRPSWSNKFAIASTDYGHFHQGNTASIPFFTLSLIVQALDVFLESMMDAEQISRACMRASSSLSTVALSACLLRPDEKWEDRAVPFFAPRLWANCTRNGWIFGIRIGDSKYGFLRLTPTPNDVTSARPDAPGYSLTVFDLQGFLNEMESEGHAPAPTRAVKRVTRLLKYTTLQGSGSTERFKLFSEDEATKFISTMDATLDMSSRHLPILEDPDAIPRERATNQGVNVEERNRIDTDRAERRAERQRVRREAASTLT